MGPRLALLAILLTWGCAPDASQDLPSDSGTQVPPGAEDAAPAEPPDAPPAPLLAFDRVYDELLVPAGCTVGCHAMQAKGGLRLTPDADAAYEALVGIPSSSPPCASQVRVSPRMPEESLLWRKLAVGVSACGLKMPVGPMAVPVSDEQAALVHDWIAGGAPR